MAKQAQDDATKAFDKIIGAEEDYIRERKDEIGNSPLTPESFFSDFAGRTVGNKWCNIPAGVGLIDNLILNGPSLLDVSVMNAEEFQEEHDLTVADVERLAREKHLVLNLHARKREDWLGNTDMLPLLNFMKKKKHHYCNGMRVDAHCETHNPDYQEIRKAHENELLVYEDDAHSAKGDAFFGRNVVHDPSRRILAWSHRWTYVDVFAPEDVFLGLHLEFNRLQDDSEAFRRYLNVYQSGAEPRVTAAAGGDFVRSPVERWVKDDIQRAGWCQDVRISPARSVTREDQVALKWLAQEVRAIPAFKSKERVSVVRLMKFLKKKESSTFRNELHQQICNVFEIARDKEIKLLPQDDSLRETYKSLSRVAKDFDKRVDELGATTAKMIEVGGEIVAKLATIAECPGGENVQFVWLATGKFIEKFAGCLPNHKHQYFRNLMKWLCAVKESRTCRVVNFIDEHKIN